MLAGEGPHGGVAVHLDLVLGVVEHVEDYQVILVKEVQAGFLKLHWHPLQQTGDLHLVEVSVQDLQADCHLEGQAFEHVQEAGRTSEQIPDVLFLGGGSF